MLRREFFGLFSGHGGLLRQGGKAQVDRRMFRLQFWHPNLVCNGASGPTIGSKVGLFHLFPALIGCFTPKLW